MIKTCIINKMKYKHPLYINIRCITRASRLGNRESLFLTFFLPDNGYRYRLGE